MNNQDLFLTMREIYESYTSISAVDAEKALLGVQTSMKGGGSVREVAMAFKMVAGNDWEPITDFYVGNHKLSQAEIDRFSGTVLQAFWRKMRKYKNQFIGLATHYIEMKEAA